MLEVRRQHCLTRTDGRSGRIDNVILAKRPSTGPGKPAIFSAQTTGSGAVPELPQDTDNFSEIDLNATSETQTPSRSQPIEYNPLQDLEESDGREVPGLDGTGDPASSTAASSYLQQTSALTAQFAAQLPNVASTVFSTFSRVIKRNSPAPPTAPNDHQPSYGGAYDSQHEFLNTPHHPYGGPPPPQSAASLINSSAYGPSASSFAHSGADQQLQGESLPPAPPPTFYNPEQVPSAVASTGPPPPSTAPPPGDNPWQAQYNSFNIPSSTSASQAAQHSTTAPVRVDFPQSNASTNGSGGFTQFLDTDTPSGGSKPIVDSRSRSSENVLSPPPRPNSNLSEPSTIFPGFVPPADIFRSHTTDSSTTGGVADVFQQLVAGHPRQGQEAQSQPCAQDSNGNRNPADFFTGTGLSLAGAQLEESQKNANFFLPPPAQQQVAPHKTPEPAPAINPTDFFNSNSSTVESTIKTRQTVSSVPLFSFFGGPPAETGTVPAVATASQSQTQEPKNHVDEVKEETDTGIQPTGAPSTISNVSSFSNVNDRFSEYDGEGAEVDPPATQPIFSSDNLFNFKASAYQDGGFYSLNAGQHGLDAHDGNSSMAAMATTSVGAPDTTNTTTGGTSIAESGSTNIAYRPTYNHWFYRREIEGKENPDGDSISPLPHHHAHVHHRPLMRKCSQQINYEVGPAGTGQPYITYPQLLFEPKMFFALGSPIGMFVTIRGIDTLGLDFKLPTCDGFFNIFHPYDPVAYRIEALINPELSGLRPVLIPHHKGRKRMHLELKETMVRVSNDLKQRVSDVFRNTLDTVWALTTMSSRPDPKAIQKEVDKVLEDQLKFETGSDVAGTSDVDSGETSLPLGRLNQTRRVDYVLQEAPFEFINEYLFALTSHVCYWDSEDTMLFVMKEIYSSLGVQTDLQVPQQSMTIERPLAGTSPVASSCSISSNFNLFPQANNR
ncbi:AGAP002379-PA-like protein [Anopheles sinensis]|uniref:AGAP002379-PA-like protein n=1 Tax=Anopheles sinensis TaxID=74873 RepID=A0A084W1M3_ANOSI|nr:AGAP002379-PA-like protein [Anopheles sinensis]